MLSRRSFLSGSLSTLAISNFLTGCTDKNVALTILLLQDSIPPQIIGNFRASGNLTGAVSIKPEAQLKTLFAALENWQAPKNTSNSSLNPFSWNRQESPVIADLVSLGDSWLARAIQGNLIRPLNLLENAGWQKLPHQWQQIVERNEQGMLATGGKIWAAPYRWGVTAIAYNKDKFADLGWTPTDWSDLWRTELRDRISIVDQPREVIGLTLKKLGYSYNTNNLNSVSALKSELLTLNQQIKFYSSDYYLQPLVVEDTWLAVGWSNEIYALRSSYPNIEVVIPRSGTAIWADIWVQPKGAPDNSKLVQQWIDFCWQLSSAQQISLFTDAASPIILSQSPENLAKAIVNNPLLRIEPSILEKSEFLHPLTEKNEREYLDLWREIRVKV